MDVDPVVLCQDLIKEIQEDIRQLDIDKQPFDTAYALVSLYYVYLKMNHVDVSNHPIQAQLQRLKHAHDEIEKHQLEQSTIEAVVKQEIGIKSIK